MAMKQQKFDAVRYRITLTYEDGSIEVITVTATDPVVVMMVARGWLYSSALSTFVRYVPINEEGKRVGVGGQYVR